MRERHLTAEALTLALRQARGPGFGRAFSRTGQTNRVAPLLIRLGYVANALRLPESSPSRTTTVAGLERLPTREDRWGRLESLARINLANTLRILRQNVGDRLLVYRLTSKLVPLATHPLADGWEYWQVLRGELAEIGDFSRANGLRLSTHPDHFTLLNSPRPEVTEASLRDLAYHHQLFLAMGLPDARLVLHVGGSYRDPGAAKARFLAHFPLVPPAVARRLALENDDRSFNAQEVLALAQATGCPMVLDVHHHRILPGDRSLEEMLPQILATWGRDRPKFHFSSPRAPTDPRSHAAYIEIEPFLDFLRLAAQQGREFDVMLEAKAKDLALLKLSEELAAKPGVRRLSEGEILMEL